MDPLAYQHRVENAQLRQQLERQQQALEAAQRREATTLETLAAAEKQIRRLRNLLSNAGILHTHITGHNSSEKANSTLDDFDPCDSTENRRAEDMEWADAFAECAP